jgi:hypothetical protein
LNPSRWSWPGLRAAAALLLAVLALPAAAAEPVGGTLSAATAHVEGDVLQRGLGQFVHMGGGGSEPPAWSIAAARIHTYEVSDEGHVVRATPPVGEPYSVSTAQTLRSLGQAPPPVQHEATQAQVTPEEAQEGYVVMVFSMGTFGQSSSLGEACLEVVEHPALNHLDGVEDADGVESGKGSAYWSSPVASGPHVRTTAPEGFKLRLEGTFTIEVVGLSGRLVGSEGGWDVASGHWESPVSPAGPTGATGATTLRESFLRIEVVDGVLEFADSDGALQWSGPNVENSVLSGTAGLTDAAGLLGAYGGPQQRVQEPAIELAPPVLLALRPLGRQMDVGVVPLDGDGQPLALPVMESPRDPVVQGVMAAGTLLALGVMGGWRVHQRSNVPTMGQVEAALESRDYRRAARSARRILHRRPEAEDARLGLAIALSKSGRHTAVVREIEPYVKTRQPSDGVLFYVLGVAQHELGQLADARTSFREAVQRTPSLQADVEKRLGDDPRPATPASGAAARGPSRQEPGGYA